LDDVFKRAMDVYQEYCSQIEGEEAGCDILMNFQDGLYQVILLPRLVRDTAPMVKKGKPGDIFANSDNFGTWGGLEVGGCFMAADRTPEAFQMLIDDPGLFRDGLNTMAINYKVTSLPERIYELIGRRIDEEEYRLTGEDIKLISQKLKDDNQHTSSYRSDTVDWILISSLMNGWNLDANLILAALATEDETKAVLGSLERFAENENIDNLIRFKAYMILFGVHYEYEPGKRFINAAISTDNARAEEFKKKAYEVYTAAARELLEDMLNERDCGFATDLASYQLEIPEGIRSVKSSSGVRIDLVSAFGGDHILPALEIGSRAINASILLKNEATGEYDFPIEVEVKKIDEPVIILRSIDLEGESVVIKTTAELFDYNTDLRVRLSKAAIVAAGIISPDFENSGVELKDILQKFGSGFEITTHVKDIPMGSGLGTSSSLAATIVSALIKFSGQSSLDEAMNNDEKMLCVMRTVLVEQLIGAIGGYADACNIFPAIKLVTTEAGDFFPAYEPIQLSAESEQLLYDSLVLTDGAYRQFSGDVAWQFEGLWVMGLSAVQEARVKTARIGELQTDLIKQGKVKEFGQLEGQDYPQRTAICPAGDNDYIKRVNDLLCSEVGDEGFDYDTSGARGGAGGCYWINSDGSMVKSDFETMFIAQSWQGIRELGNKFTFEGKPRIYDWRLNHEGVRFNIKREDSYQVPKPEPDIFIADGA